MKNGTDKQIKWAQKIIITFVVDWARRLPDSIAKLEEKIKAAQKRLTTNPDDERGVKRWTERIAEAKEGIEAIHQVTELLHVIDDARLIIKMRHRLRFISCGVITSEHAHLILSEYDYWLRELYPLEWVQRLAKGEMVYPGCRISLSLK